MLGKMVTRLLIHGGFMVLTEGGGFTSHLRWQSTSSFSVYLDCSLYVMGIQRGHVVEV